MKTQPDRNSIIESLGFPRVFRSTSTRQGLGLGHPAPPAPLLSLSGNWCTSGDDSGKSLHSGDLSNQLQFLANSPTRHLEENLDDWLEEELENYSDDDYLVFDCPGQIELFTHVPVLRNFVEHLKRKNFQICAVYLLDSQFMTDVTKFISGCMASLSAMIQLELPHVNILSKMDLVANKKDLENYLNPEAHILLSELNQHMAPLFAKLNKALAGLVDEYSMVSFVPLDLRKESSIQYVLSLIDNAIQYGEDADVKIRDFDPEDGDDDS